VDDAGGGTGGGTVFETRQPVGKVAEEVSLRTLGAGVAGYCTWLFGSRPAQELGAAFWPVRVLVALLGAVTLTLAAQVVTMMVQAATRPVVVRVDADGLTLGPRWFWSRCRTVPWCDVRAVTLRRDGRDGRDGRAAADRTSGTRAVVDLLEARCRDGAVHRRRLDRRRYDATALGRAIRTVSPRIDVTVHGEAVPG